MKLYVLNGGRIEILDWARFQPGAGAGVRRWLSDSCFLVVHPEGTLVWDTGLPDELAGVPEGLTIADVARFHVDGSLEGQLAAVGHPADTIDFLALSHFHQDHVGNVCLFGNATLLVQAEDHAAAFGASPGDHGFDPATYGSLRASRTTLLTGDYDVFGDGSVLIKRLPGHTPGNQSLFVRLPETGPVLISGDLTHSLDNWAKKVVPALNSDPDESLRSLARAERLIAEEGAVLWVQHDLDQQSALKHAPDYYT